MNMLFPTEAWSCNDDSVRQFRRRFQMSLRECVRYGFQIEESFGLVWNEVREEIRLSEEQEMSLYGEMIDWAKKCMAQGFIPTCSQDLFTEELPFSRGETGTRLRVLS